MVLPIIIAAIGTVYVVKKVRKRRQRKRARKGRSNPIENDEIFYDYDGSIEPPAYSITADKQKRSHMFLQSRGDNGL
jgi:hypothetical protein